MPATERKSSCFQQGSLSEKRFAAFLEARNIPFTSTVGTDADTKGKVDFLVNGKTVQVKAPSRNGLAPGDLTIEHRAVNGSVGWLHRVDYVVKFCDDKTFLKINAEHLRDAVEWHLPEPPEKAPRSKAKAMGGWYARYDWQGRSRAQECCYVVTVDWLMNFVGAEQCKL